MRLCKNCKHARRSKAGMFFRAATIPYVFWLHVFRLRAWLIEYWNKEWEDAECRHPTALRPDIKLVVSGRVLKGVYKSCRNMRVHNCGEEGRLFEVKRMNTWAIDQ